MRTPDAQHTADGLHAPRPVFSDALFDMLLEALREHRRITFALSDELGENCGVTNLEHAVVFLADRNTAATMRATMAHEVMHLLCQECPDDEVEQMAAEALVPLPAALEGHATGTLHEVAARCGVDVQMVRARIRSVPSQREAEHGVG